MFWTGPVPSGSVLRRAMRKWGVAVVVASGLATGAVVHARTPEAPAGVPPVVVASLPPEARQTHQLILNGGPFPYQKDGTVFGNREGHLPQRARGYYREYTVITPGARNRSTKRIVTGGGPVTDPAQYFYTGDHYDSFCVITDAGRRK